MSRPSCSSPLACTSNDSPPLPSTGHTRRLTLVSASICVGRRAVVMVVAVAAEQQHEVNAGQAQQGSNPHTAETQHATQHTQH